MRTSHEHAIARGCRTASRSGARLPLCLAALTTALLACASSRRPDVVAAAPPPVVAAALAPTTQPEEAYDDELEPASEEARRAILQFVERRVAQHFVEALAGVEAALRAHPEDVALRIVCARATADGGNIDAAVRLLREGLRQRPEDADLLTVAGGLRLRQADRGSTPSDRQGAVTSPPSTDRAADAAFVRERREEARELFRSAIAARRNHLMAAAGLASTFDALEAHEEAVTAWERVVALTPVAEARERLAVAMMRVGRRDRATELIESVVARDPRRASAHASLATLYEAAGRGDEARASRGRAEFYRWVHPFDVAMTDANAASVTTLTARLPVDDTGATSTAHAAVRAEIARLAQLGTDDARGLLAAFARHHADDALTDAAVEALRAMGPASAGALRTLFERGYSTHLTRATGEALARLRDPSAFELLASALPHDRVVLSVEAAHALDLLGDARAVPLLVRAAEASAPSGDLERDVAASLARSRAVLALGGFETPEARAALEGLVADPEVGLDAHAALYRATRDRSHLTALERAAGRWRGSALLLLRTYVAEIGTPTARAAAQRARLAHVRELNLRCRGRDAASCYELGEMHQSGRGVARDERRAAAFFGLACEGGNMQGCAYLGYLHDAGRGVARDPRRAVVLYNRACEGRVVHGCYSLGLLYEGGRGVARDEVRAAELYDRACEGDSSAACYRLGNMRSDGRGVTRDEPRAVELYDRACEGGSMPACSTLGYMLSGGRGVTRDPQRAIALYERACEGGEMSGCSNLASMYSKGDGVTRDERRAAELYDRACEGGHTPGCGDLGWMYWRARGVPRRDAGRAVGLFQRACEGGSNPHCSLWATALALGQGVPQDLRRALEIRNRACDGGNGGACYASGLQYALGSGTSRDPAQAAARWRRAAETFQRECAEHGRSCSWPGYLYRFGRGVARDRSRATALLTRTCEAESVACNELGEHAQEDAPGARNDAQIAAWFQRACDAEYWPGCAHLADALELGLGVPRAPERAADLRRRAVAAMAEELPFTADSSVGLTLGRAYLNGHEVARDPARAVAAFERACASGSAAACVEAAALYARGVDLPRDDARAATLREDACALGETSRCGPARPPQ